MIILDCPQGSLDWLIQRLWRLTASELKVNITSTGKLSKSEAALANIDKLIAGIELGREMIRLKDEIAEMDEWKLKQFMAHYTGDKFKGNLHTERGHDFEDDAVAILSEKTGIQFDAVGMCIMGENAQTGVVSCSPDGLGYNSQKVLVTGAEVKNPNLSKYLTIVADDVLPPDYALQVHAGMAICELESWHFGAHFKGKPLFHKVVKRDAFTDEIRKSLIEFKAIYQQRYEKVMGAVERLGRSTPKTKPAPKPEPQESLI